MSEFNFDIDSKNTFSIPNQVVTELFLCLDNVASIKFFLYTLYRFQAEKQRIQFVTLSQVEKSESIQDIIGAETKIEEVLDDLIRTGAFVSAKGIYRNKEDRLFFLNNARGRESVRAIEAGDWIPKSNTDFNTVIERPSVYQLYEDNLGSLTPMIVEMLDDALEDYSYQWIQEAIKVAIKKEARNWAYVEAILKRWKKDKNNPWKGSNDDPEKDEDPFAHVYRK